MIILFGLYYSRCIKLEIKLDMGDIDIRSSYKDDLPMLYRTFNQTAPVFLAMIIFCLIACAQSSYAQSIRSGPQTGSHIPLTTVQYENFPFTMSDPGNFLAVGNSFLNPRHSRLHLRKQKRIMKIFSIIRVKKFVNLLLRF